MKTPTTSFILFCAVLVPSLALIPKSSPTGRALADLQQLWFTPTSKSDPESNTSNKDSSSLNAESINEENLIRHAKNHRKWGVDNTNEPEYWFDSRIHTLGNCGFMGAVHAACAPLATKMIDVLAYGGVDIRQKVRRSARMSINSFSTSYPVPSISLTTDTCVLMFFDNAANRLLTSSLQHSVKVKPV